jgi:hypothetical protein
MARHGRRSSSPGLGPAAGRRKCVAEPRPEAGREGERPLAGRAARWARTRGPRRRMAGRGRKTPAPGESKPLR